MTLKKFALTITTTSFATAAFAANTSIRLEAEDAVLADDHKVVVTEDAKASGGKYVAMKDGNLEFKVTVAATGYYTLWANYQLPTESGSKIQNLTVNNDNVDNIGGRVSGFHAKAKNKDGQADARNGTQGKATVSRAEPQGAQHDTELKNHD